MSNLWKLNLILLFLILILVWTVIVTYPESRLHIIACDVGQGDAILITHKSNQILIDGGPNTDVIDCLSDHVAFWDRKIELVVLTHPQRDHYQGLIEVFERYEVGHLLTSPLDSSNQEYEVLKNAVGGGSTEVTNPSEGVTIRVGLIYLDVLSPSSQDYSESNITCILEDKICSEINPFSSGVLGTHSTDENLNDYSVVLLLDYYNFEALLTGDIDPLISDQMAKLVDGNSRVGDGVVEYLKVPHHGSRNGLSKKLLESVNPALAVISVGENNSYGHPHKGILNMLKANGTRVLRTDEAGDVVVVSDGEEIWVE